MSGSLRVVVASGKGGTGKTTLATSLAEVLCRAGVPTAYLDCDVEEPNGHLLLRPTVREVKPVTVPVPEVDRSRCTLCGACASACGFAAISVLPRTVLTFPELCHGCGACALACPQGAIREVPRATGVVELGSADELCFVGGRLDVGEAMAPPVVRAVLDSGPTEGTQVVDAPPGTSCPVVETVKAADVVVLVTEPTPFGLNDLELAVEMVRDLGVPLGVVLNRARASGVAIEEYCARERIPVLLSIPNDLRVARAYARGELAVRTLPELGPGLLEVHRALGRLALAGVRGGRRGASPARLAAAPQAETTPRPVLQSPIVSIGSGRELPELVVISGKGGTGKTSIAAALAALVGTAAVADCDVDAPDLHLVLQPEVLRRSPFSGGNMAVIDPERCTGCSACVAHCRFDAIHLPDDEVFHCEVDAGSCEGCGVCVAVCRRGAVRLAPRLDGEWYVSSTRFGPLVHARLGVARENSGKLVSIVRGEARAAAAAQGRTLIICDGSPGIGCPVIASLSGARLALLVAEPTLSGLHDFTRVAELCGRLHVPAVACVNRADIALDVAARIEAAAERLGIAVLGRIPYDESVTAAQVRKLTVIEHAQGPAAVAIRGLWRRVRAQLESPPAGRRGPDLPEASRRPARPAGREP
jgi:MinD superfamily P-loop ATPase